MKELKLFMCDVCGTKYNDKRTCQRCESTHIKPKKVLEAKYLPFTQNAKGYPTRINIEFENGESVVYSR